MSSLRWFLVAGLVAAPTLLPSTAGAQPAVRDQRNRPAPTEAPPAPRAETSPAKAGYVWIAGRWDWKEGKWDWVAGHYERERAGKRWNAGAWQQREGKWQWTEGGWVDGSAPPPAVTPPGPPGPPPGPGPMANGGRRRDWKIERPTVSSYWPIKGKVGSRVVIKGQNFPTDAQVMFAGKIVPGAKVTADRIVFVVPPGAVSGAIELNAGRKRPVAVGGFEVAASYDPVAEQKRIEDERRKAAEAAWAAQQAKLAKDRAARQAEIDRRHAEEAQTRDRRRQQRIAEIEAKWERAFLADDETQAELTLHAQRVADLERMKEIAELKADTKLGVRIQVAEEREDARHDQRMAALKAAFGGAK